MTKHAIESNLDMGFLMPLYSKWLTSQLQFMKDRSVRDIDTKEPAWKRIYPQEEGIPVKSPSGKYWIKLRFMGKERLVEIDDRMPCDGRKKLLLPRSADTFEIWPQLLVKAYLKLYSFKWYPSAQYDTQVGDGAFVHSMTGLIPEKIRLSNFERDGLPLFRKILSDDYYFGKKTYVTCFCGHNFKPSFPSAAKNKKSSKQIMALNAIGLPQQQRKKLLRFRDVAALALSITTGKKLTLPALQKDRQSYVIPGFGYALMDFFENKNVNMNIILKQEGAGVPME